MLIQVPVLGTNKRSLDAGRMLHRVDDNVVHSTWQGTPAGAVWAQISATYGDNWYGILFNGDGNGVAAGQHAGVAEPAQDVRDKLFDCAIRLNAEIHHGGFWVVIWVQMRAAFLFFDDDCDLQFTVDFDEVWVRIRFWPWTEFLSRAEAAWKEFGEQMRILDLRADQHQIKRAKGEQSKGPPA